VIASILACYAGGIEKTLNPASGQRICMLGGHLLQAKAFMPEGVPISEICDYCKWDSELTRTNLEAHFANASSMALKCVNGYPGFASSALIR
jgi:hypothetical protein